jgi:hypothetical protein
MGGRLIPQRARRQLVPVEAAEARRGGQPQDAGAGQLIGFAVGGVMAKRLRTPTRPLRAGARGYAPDPI